MKLLGVRYDTMEEFAIDSEFETSQYDVQRGHAFCYLMFRNEGIPLL
jgi:hypothetical protein